MMVRGMLTLRLLRCGYKMVEFLGLKRVTRPVRSVKFCYSPTLQMLGIGPRPCACETSAPPRLSRTGLLAFVILVP